MRFRPCVSVQLSRESIPRVSEQVFVGFPPALQPVQAGVVAANVTGGAIDRTAFPLLDLADQIRHCISAISRPTAFALALKGIPSIVKFVMASSLPARREAALAAGVVETQITASGSSPLILANAGKMIRPPSHFAPPICFPARSAGVRIPVFFREKMTRGDLAITMPMIFTVAPLARPTTAAELSAWPNVTAPSLTRRTVSPDPAPGRIVASIPSAL